MNNSRIGRVRWMLIGWMFVISAIAYLDRVNISIAGSEVQKEFGLDNLQLGWVFSAFVAGYALFQAPGGRLADRFGPRNVLTAGAVWWAVFTALTALVPAGATYTLVMLLVTRFVLGLGEAVVYPASNRLVSAWIPSQERGVANGLIFAGVGAGAGITPPLITYILVNYGWRWSFWISAFIGLAAGVVWYLLARDKPNQHPWVGGAEIRHIQAGLPKETAGSSVEILPWRAIIGSKDVLAVSFSYFCYGYVAYIFFTWFFIYLNKVRQLDLKSSSVYSMLPFIAMASCSPLGGWISDKLTRRFGKRIGRCGVAGVSLALAAFFIALGTQAADARLATFVLAGGAGALYLSASSFWSVTADIGGASAGSVSGVMNMCNQTAGALTASLTPWIAARFGWTTSFMVAAALCLVGSLAWLVVNPEHRLTGTKAASRGTAAPAR
ncbi:MAG: MFS transporter [Bryobacterales bacterium]|nr:MFS transporter [Bryobacterales bacterium]